MGIVVGLGLTRLLTGLAAIAQNPRRAKVSGLHLLWTLFVLVELVLFWWWEYALIEQPHWSFGDFAFVVGYAMTLFLMAALLVPDRLDDYAGYEDYFLSRRHWFFGVFAATLVFDLIDTLGKGGDYAGSVGADYWIQIPISLALAALAIWSRDRRLHYAIVLLQLAYQAWWIWLLFYTNDCPGIVGTC
ncbi:MAG: hypothetical protein EOP22_17185 [Hyphomicrobiales bacterium]|nr:MAG: hypothetical protein EOP22_17185 [Hyphomicrobiales bacterium]